MRKLFLLLGDPVTRSRSPAIHSRAFQLLGVDAVYAPCTVAAADLPAAFAGLRALGAQGCNVTVPHKEAAAALCDRLEAFAQAAGATNCVVREGAQLVGHNTDGPGLLRALAAQGLAVAGREALVLGAGGAARAAALALAAAGSKLTVHNRGRERSEALLGLLHRAGHPAQAAAPGTPGAEAALGRAGLLVHCTTVGMGSESLPLGEELLGRLPAGCAVVDLVYQGAPARPPGDTALLAAVRARGLATVDGVDVLVHQAIASLELWLGRPSLTDLAPELRAAALG